jgi:hypothetical protein
MITKFKIFENHYDIDPYGEEKWGDVPILGYFICDRHRAEINLNYCDEFYKRNHPKLYESVYNAYKAYEKGFYDDSDVKIVRLFSDGEMEILNWNNIRNEIRVRINP